MPHHNGNGGGDDDKLGDFEVGKLHHSLTRIKRLVFIRHGEKLDEDDNGKTSYLSTEGITRADNLYRVFGGGPGSVFKPDVIYAMQQGKHADNSNRPYLTVAPLAIHLHMDPVPDERRENDAGVFNNQFNQRERSDLVHDVVKRARNHEYDDKTVLFCWEHKNIPYIVGELGLSDHELHWGLNPESGADDRANYTAIWSFTPSDKRVLLQVYKQFEVEPSDKRSNTPPRVTDTNNDDYTNVVWEREE